jgi:P27 family predicted phage terminase small subunit
VGGFAGGRKPKPTAIKIAEGNLGKRPLNDREPKPAVGIPERPRHLRDKGARRYWKFYCDDLVKIGVLTVADGMALGALCDAYADYVDAKAYIEKHGAEYEEPVLDSTGQVVGHKIKANPAVVRRYKAFQAMKSMLVEFGLTPSSRGRLKVDAPAKPVDPAAEFFDEVPQLPESLR